MVSLRPTSALDTETGWSMMHELQGEPAIYGNIHIKWVIVKSGVRSALGTHWIYAPEYRYYMSLDGGLSWKSEQMFEKLYRQCFNVSMWDSAQREQNLAAVYAVRTVWKRQRAKELKKLNDALPSEEKALKAANLAAKKAEIAAIREATADKNAVKAINAMISLGPNLVRLKEKADRVIMLMSKGGIDKPIVQHLSKESRLKEAVYLLDQFEKHILKCQARTGK